MPRIMHAGRSVNARSLNGCGHACAIVHGSGEELNWMLPMVAELTPDPVRTIRIVGEASAEDETARMVAWQAEHPGTRPGNVRTARWKDTYLLGGGFHQRGMLTRIEEMIGNGHSDGYPLVRVVADMAWATGEVEGVNDLAEYESLLNTVIDPTAAEVVCVYDLNAFSRSVMVGLERASTSLHPGFMLDIIRAHPFVITDGEIRANGFYSPPESFLPELAARRASRASS